MSVFKNAIKRNMESKSYHDRLQLVLNKLKNSHEGNPEKADDKRDPEKADDGAEDGKRESGGTKNAE